MEIIGFIGLVILFFLVAKFLILLVKSFIWDIKDIFGPVIDDIKTSIKK